jgi:hypothetical protein
MQMSDASDYASYSDSQLDDLYATTYDSYAKAASADKLAWSMGLNNVAQEILTRLQSPGSFIQGIFGGVRFPQYNAIQAGNPKAGGFQQVAVAQQAVKENAGKVASKLGLPTLAKYGAIGLSLAAIALYLSRRRK